MNVAKIAYLGVSFSGLAGLTAVTAIYWKNITENPVVKYLFNSMYEISHMDDLLSSMEKASIPLDANMPTYTLLISKNSTNEEVNDTFGNLYKNVLVSDSNNDDWWKWSIKKLSQAGALAGEFVKLKDKGENDFAELRQTCGTIHKKQNRELKDGERDNAWFLCSAFRTQPHSADEIPKGRYRNKFGSSHENRSAHLIADRPANKNVWDELYKKLISSATDEEFKKVKVGYDKKYHESKPSLNKMCDKFFAQTTEEIKAHQENIWKYCSLSGKDLTSSSNQSKET